MGWRFGWHPEILERVLQMPWRAFVPLPRAELHFWNTNGLDAWPLLQAAGGVALLAAVVACLWRRKPALATFLLGAAGLGDIGRHFPDSDASYEGADSRALLRRVRELTRKHRILNVDSTILAQAPRMAPHVQAMVRNIAADLEIAVEAVNVKAKTTERLGFAGRGEGIAHEWSSACALRRPPRWSASTASRMNPPWMARSQ